MSLACEITAWMQLLALAGHQARRWEPKRLRLRLFSIAGKLAATGRTVTMRLSAHAPWSRLLTDAVTALRTLHAPTKPDPPLSQQPGTSGPWCPPE